MNLPFDRSRDLDPMPALHQLAGAYALGALPTDERLVFEAWLDEQADEATRAEVAELVATAALLASEAAEQPPASLRDAVLAIADETRQLPPVVSDLAAERARRRPAWSGRVAGVTAAVVAAVALVAGTAVLVRSDLDGRVGEIEEAIAGDAGLDEVLAFDDARVVSADNVTLVVSEQAGRAVFIARDLAPAPPGRTYELWLVRADGPTPAGLFDASAEGTAVQAVAADLHDVMAFAVTVEPRSGSTAPTTDPFVVVNL